MAVLDPDGKEAGTVSAVQLPGTDVRPDIAEGVAEELMLTGYLLIDGSGYRTNDLYAGGEQIREVAPGAVTLGVRVEELHRA